MAAPGRGPELNRPADAALSGDEEVLHALLRRRATGSTPGARTDPHRIALVVGGGGMRGAYAGGMVHALEQAGLSDAFDVVYGSSAGAFVGTALVLRHGHDAARIFPDDMACKAFIDPRRLGTRRPMVSLDYLLDEILVVSKPTDWAALAASPVPLRVVVTDAADMTPHVLEGLGTEEEWKLAMRATATIPWLAGPPVELGGRRWVDGSVGDPLPVLRALRDGATHVLALLTRTVPELRRSDPGERAPLWARSLDVVIPGLGAMTQDVRRHADSLALLSDAAHPDRGGAHLLAITPARTSGVRGLTVDVERVEAASQLGHEAAVAALRAVNGGTQH
ncbi:patatin-like phospholipase family protein [Pseudonocardia acidicola]|uniref:Patatin family protein n=1 Tax=Pseudonocardia acidicola TaxID=2724939 RepID=A0ABX1SJ34_9PSEU|nr:patatin family protein [Pseudonocardia acidicola]NMI00965.1 patatin family protein [Pseudonocardia acidicola]